MNFNIFIIIIALGCAALIAYPSLFPSRTYGKVIILNGPSASGKTSIQKEFQHLMMPTLWLKTGIDSLFDKPMPDITLENMPYWQSENPIRWVTTITDVYSNPIITLHTGPEGQKAAYAMNKAIVAYAKTGCNVIVDYIAYKKEWIDDLQKKLKGIPTTWVKVSIPLEVLEQREAARATSPKGHARSHYDTVYWNIPYDIEVHSDTQTATQIAQQLKIHLQK